MSIEDDILINTIEDDFLQNMSDRNIRRTSVRFLLEYQSSHN